MKMKFGAIVVDGRGKIGGHVASKNRAGAYLRTKVTPVNPGTSYQTNVRSRLAGLSIAWRGLTAAQRLSWNAAVSDYMRTDIFGDLKAPTGFNLYQRLNNNLLLCGEAAITSPPLPQAVTNFTSLTVAADNSDSSLTLTFAAAIAATHKIKFFATAPMSPGKSYAKSEFRLIDVLTSADASPLNMGTEYEARIADIGPVGEKIFVRLVPVLLATGQAGLPVEASCIIAA